MKKLFTLVALAGLGLSTIGCSEKKPPAPAPTTPAPAETKTDGATPAPATDEKK